MWAQVVSYSIPASTDSVASASVRLDFRLDSAFVRDVSYWTRDLARRLMLHCELDRPLLLFLRVMVRDKRGLRGGSLHWRWLMDCNWKRLVRRGMIVDRLLGRESGRLS
jgi:hypothetical protein